MMGDNPVIPDDDGSIYAAQTALEHAVNHDPTTATTAIVPSGRDDAAHHKTLVVTQMRAVTEHRARIQRLTQEVQARIETQMAPAVAKAKELATQIRLLEDGLDALNLYLGRHEMIEPLRGGTPAPAGTPIVVRQTVLSMDQESLIAAVTGGIDARKVDEFYDWLLADDANLNQILPEIKGVVALMPRLTDRDYGDPWVQQAMDEANRVTHFLIRNGEQVFVTSCGFAVGHRLIPAADEFTRFFETDLSGRPMEPGSQQWAHAEQRASAQQRHYMKVGLVLQGLADRTAVFGPQPEQLSFLSAGSYDTGDILLVTDAERALDTGAPNFFEWLADKNSKLRPGMRIVGSFNGEQWSDANDLYTGDRYNRGKHSRLTPASASPPPTGVIHRLDRRVEHGFKFGYERTDSRWGYEHGDHGRWDEWPYKNNAGCVIRPGDRFVVPFDLVTVTELETFITTRRGREQYLSLVPLLQAVVEAKQAEAEAEAPFRALIVGELVKIGVDVGDAEQHVGELVDWWKLTNRFHRPLIAGNVEDQTKTIGRVVAEYRNRHINPVPVIDDMLIGVLLDAHPDSMFIARRNSGGIVVLEPEDYPVEGVWFREYSYTSTARKLVATKRWRIGTARFAAMPPAYQTSLWDRWQTAASRSEWLTGDELVTAAADSAAADDQVVWSEMQMKPGGLFRTWNLHTRFQYDQDRPLTGDVTELVVRLIDYTWKRRNGQVLIERVGSYNYVSSEWPWDPSNERRYTGADTHNLFRNDDLIGFIDADNNKVAEHKEIVAAARGRMFTWGSRLADRWDQFHVACLYTDHVDEYGTDEFWADADKSYPKLDRGPLHWLALTLIENDLFDDTMNVTEAVAAAGGLDTVNGNTRRKDSRFYGKITADMLNLAPDTDNHAV